MPADFIIDTEQKTVFSKATGAFSFSDISDHMNRLLQHPDFNPAFNQVFDYRDATQVDFSSEEIRRLAEVNVFSAASKRAFVVSSDLHFGLARMFGIYRDINGERGIMVFRDMKEAREWLALPAGLENLAVV